MNPKMDISFVFLKPDQIKNKIIEFVTVVTASQVTTKRFKQNKDKNGIRTGNVGLQCWQKSMEI